MDASDGLEGEGLDRRVALHREDTVYETDEALSDVFPFPFITIFFRGVDEDGVEIGIEFPEVEPSL